MSQFGRAGGPAPIDSLAEWSRPAINHPKALPITDDGHGLPQENDSHSPTSDQERLRKKEKHDD
jgi:hypothetical protein